MPSLCSRNLVYETKDQKKRNLGEERTRDCYSTPSPWGRDADPKSLSLFAGEAIKKEQSNGALRRQWRSC